jgi:hypothetical protein
MNKNDFEKQLVDQSPVLMTLLICQVLGRALLDAGQLV